MDRLDKVARGMLVAAVLSAACGKTGANPNGTDDSGGTGAGSSGAAAGGASARGGSKATSGSAGRGGNGGAAAGSGAGATSAGATSTAGATSIAGTAGVAGAGGMPPDVPCAEEDECPEAQSCLDKTCRCLEPWPDWCEAEQLCTTFEMDPEHCGGCQPCGTTQACHDGVCTPTPTDFASFPGCGELLLEPVAPWVYVAERGTGKLWRLGLGAPAAPTLLANDIGGVNALTVAGTTAYVASDTGVARVALAGGQVSKVADATQPVRGVAAAGSKVFFSTGSEVRSIDATAQSGSGELLVTALGSGLPNGLVVSGDNLLFIADASFNLEVVRLGSKDHVKLSGPQISMQLGHRSLQVDGQWAYWTHDGWLARQPFGTDNESRQGLGDCSGQTTAFAVTGQAFYCANQIGQIRKRPFGDDQAHSLARNLDSVTSMVVDASHLYVAHGCNISQLPL